MKKLRKFDRRIRFTSSVVAMATLISCASASAEPTKYPYAMIAYEDAAYGDMIVNGQYDRAIDKISGHKKGRGGYFPSTNLCVAYTKSGDMTSAEIACEAAIAIAQSGRAIRPTGATTRTFQRSSNREYLTVALSNRGVVHALMGEHQLARECLEEAAGIRSRYSTAKENLAYLELTQPATVADIGQEERGDIRKRN